MKDANLCKKKKKKPALAMEVLGAARLKRHQGLEGE